MKVSIIIPCFNAALKIGSCLSSLAAIDMNVSDYEVIFVDDHSTDHTFHMLENICKSKTNWHVYQLSENSGSPSRPRNYGTNLAKGEFVFYLDCDDEILPDTLTLHYQEATRYNADMVRGSLYVNDGKVQRLANKLPEWDDALDDTSRISLFLEKQTLTKSCLIRTAVLRNNSISYPEDMKMGEDTVFVSKALIASKKTIYIDHPTYIYNCAPTFVQSTTKSFGEKEACDQLLMWDRLQEIFSKIGIDYFKVRLHVNLRYVLTNLIQYSRFDISEHTFLRLSKFIKTVGNDLKKSSFLARHLELLASIEAGDFDWFRKLSRPRLLIAGHDLKFISPLYPVLSRYFDIREDEWKGHNDHNEAHSRECLEWAEYIWCEWLLGNAVWYSENKKNNQRLVVRMHRFEVGLDYGSRLRINNVDAIITVTVLFFERLLERFQNIPRSKVRLMPLGYLLDEYVADFSEERLHTLAMIGILPSGKGLDKALQILAALRKHDTRFKLEIFGKKPEELSWIRSDKNEREYFALCEKYIEENNLSSFVHFNGHSDIRAALSHRKVGFVLSLSKNVRELPGFEAFHTAVGDGFAGGAVSLILHFLGAEYVWSSESIHHSLESLVENILMLNRNPDIFLSSVAKGKELLVERYCADDFALNVRNCFVEAI
jgi:glycosyltransferase involved in cell wall biosynthesis